MRKNVRVITCDENRKALVDKLSNDISIAVIDELMDGAYSHNSLLAMRKDWSLFTQFCFCKGVKPLPASSTAVRLFLENESKVRKYATIKRYTVTISLFHRTLGFADPTAPVAVRNLLSQLRIEKKSDAQPTIAFNKQHLLELTQKLAKSTHKRDIRNLAIYHLMFECMLKRSELKRLRLDDANYTESLCAVSIGEQSYRLSQHASDQLKRWLDVRGDRVGVLFSAIDKHGNVNNQPLDDSSIYRILRAASDQLKLNVNFSGQSLRVGATQELASQGVKVKDIQTFGRWKSAAMPYQYIGHREQAARERMVYKSFKPWD